MGDFIITHIGNDLKIHNKWEYDNGLYIENGWETDPSTWKQVKELLKNKKRGKIILINNGRCPRCGCKLTPKNYKNEIENSLDIPFEYDFFYCNECKQKQVQDFEEFVARYDEQEDLW